MGLGLDLLVANREIEGKCRIPMRGCPKLTWLVVDQAPYPVRIKVLWWNLPYSEGPRQLGWRIRGFEGARASPEHTSAPPPCQKQPLKIKEKLCKIPCDTKIEQKYGHLRLN